MSKEDKAPVEQSDDAGGDSEQGKNQTVSFDSYQKLLKEKKTLQSKFSELEEKVSTLTLEKTQAEGNKDEAINSLKKQNDELKGKLDKTTKTFAWTTLTGQIKQEATKQGCKDPEKLIRLMDDEDLRSIEIGENFAIDSSSVKAVIEKSKKENGFLFETSAKPPAAPGKPGNKPPVEGEKSLKDMTLAELKAEYLKARKTT